MNNAIAFHTYTTAEALLGEIIARKNPMFENTYSFFRGESSLTYKLLPSVLRDTSSGYLSLIRAEMIQDPPITIDEENHQIFLEYILLIRFFRATDKRGLALPLINQIRNKFAISEIASYLDWLNKHSKDPKSTWIPNELRTCLEIDRG